MFVQVFTGWRYRTGARERIAAMGFGQAPSPAPRPDVPGLIARLLATASEDPDTGIGLWVWEDEAACRAYEANRPPEATAAIERDLDESAMREETFDALFLGCRMPG
jgi:heme-degrading monooxygenase HmoA